MADNALDLAARIRQMSQPVADAPQGPPPFHDYDFASGPFAEDPRAAFLRSEKNTAPYDDTIRRHTFLPIGTNGYNSRNAADMGDGGLMLPGIVHDVIEGGKWFGPAMRGQKPFRDFDPDTGESQASNEAMGHVNALVGAAAMGSMGSAASAARTSARPLRNYDLGFDALSETKIPPPRPVAGSDTFRLPVLNDGGFAGGQPGAADYARYLKGQRDLQSRVAKEAAENGERYSPPSIPPTSYDEYLHHYSPQQQQWLKQHGEIFSKDAARPEMNVASEARGHRDLWDRISKMSKDLEAETGIPNQDFANKAFAKGEIDSPTVPSLSWPTRHNDLGKHYAGTPANDSYTSQFTGDRLLFANDSRAAAPGIAMGGRKEGLWDKVKGSVLGRPEEPFTLSSDEVKALKLVDKHTDGTNFSYNIQHPNGRNIGEFEGRVDGNNMHIDWIGGNRGGRRPSNDPLANNLGIGGLRNLREQIRGDFPDVDTFSGVRISGANPNRDQSVKILANDSRAAAPALVSQGEKQQGIDQDQLQAILRKLGLAQ